MSGQVQSTPLWSPPWVAVAGGLGVAAVVLAEHARVPYVLSWSFPFVAVFGGFVTFLVTLAKDAWLRTHAHRIVVWVAIGVWMTWAAEVGWTHPVVLSLVGGAMVLTGLAYVTRTPPDDEQPQDGWDRRPQAVRVWELRLQKILRNDQLRVTAVVPWDNPEDGERIHVGLPADGTLTWDDLADTKVRNKIAAAVKLLKGCTVQALDGDHQGEIVFDVMLRDTLRPDEIVEETFQPRSINDPFPIMRDALGHAVMICLRIMSAVIGGTTGSGKTTLLDRIIMWLAQCVDCVIWVADYNGGGVAEPWVRPWARGLAVAPVVDWVAEDEVEAAVMMAVAKAIVTDRKTSPEAVERMEAANTKVLPVDADLPLLLVLSDEGGELAQKQTILGQLVVAGIAQLAQIGRATGGRVVMSVLRGTSDLLDRPFKVVSGIRVCLRMLEQEEYDHVLGEDPGKTKLTEVGYGYVKRYDQDVKPIMGRTADITRSMITRGAVACGPLRPVLDERARQVAAAVRTWDVMGGKDMPDELKILPAMRDVDAGLAYENRWLRFEHRLAAMRGERYVPPQQLEADPALSVAAAPRPVPAAQAHGEPDSALAELNAAVGLASPPPMEAAPVRVRLDEQAAVDAEFDRLTGGLGLVEPKLTARDHVLAVLTEAYPRPLTPAEVNAKLVEREAGVARTYLLSILKQLVMDGAATRPAGGVYTVPR